MALAAALASGPAVALDGQALRHYAAAESAARQGAVEMATGHLGKALQLLQAKGRGESEDAARILAELAELHLRLRRPDRAREALARSLAITRRAVGETHPDFTKRQERLNGLPSQ